ncbi:hypothetical protein BN2497_2521 [Janthinobacterium sp. CG23_2]|nr:hypothetical protein BN2497_2521 [Janthinobacterium sp. CG23_2]CUU27658.1 hypothetical protein BN3177_2521 [Janthinobacterium sp. CG23_2]
MGLLDMFNDPQSAGLLSAGANILERSGDTSRPYGIGQALGTGINTYMQTNAAMRARQLQEAQEKQEAERRALQIQQMQGEMQVKQQVLERNDRIRARLTGGAPAQPQQQAAENYGFASAAPGGPMSPKTGGPDWMQQFQSSSGASAVPPQQRQSPMQTPGSDRQSAIAYLTNEAQVRTEEGDIEGASKALEHLAKLSPKFATEARTVMGPNGKPMLVQMADDGTVRPIQGGYGAAEKLHFGDNGQNLVGMDQYTGQVKSSIGKQQTPDSMADDRRAAAIRAQSASQFGQRLSFDKQQVEGTGPDASEAMVDAIGTGKMSPPSGYALRNPKMLQMMERVAQKYPDFDATEYDGRKRATRDFATGKQGDSIRSFAVASDHLGQLKGLITALDNGNTPLVNKYSNIIAQQTGSAAPTNFDAAKGIVAKEVLKSIVAGGGGVEERQELVNLLDNAKTTKQLNGVVDTYLHLMAAQKSGLERQYELSTGRKDAATRFNYKADASGGHGGAQQPAAAGSKSISLSDIAETARKSGRSTAEVTAAARAKGYTIGGQ